MAANFELKISITESNINIPNNTSVITVEINAQSNNGWSGWSGYQTRLVLSGGVAGTIYIPSYNIGVNKSFPLSKTSYTITHDPNGAKSVSVNATWYSDGVVGTISGSASKTLTTIPRASDITSFPNFDVEGTFSLGVNKKSPSFTDNLQIKYGSTILKTLNGYSSGTVISFTADEKKTIFNLMTAVNSATFTAVITTLNGSTSIGTVSKNATGSIYNANPLFSGFTWKTTNHLDLHDNQTIIKGYSNIGVTVPMATAQKGATIKSYKVQCGTKTYTTASITEITQALNLTGVDDSIIKAYAVDSRGNATEMIKSVVKFIDYKPLILSSLSYDRGDGGIGTKITINFNGSAWVGSFGLVSNVLTAQYFYKENGSGTWIQGVTTINPTTTASFFFGGEIRGDMGALGFNNGKNFDLKVTVIDKLSNSSKEVVISKGVPQVAYGDGGVSFGGFYNEQNGGALQIEGERVELMSNRYSTTEQFTGKYWIDGKRIYSKVVVINNAVHNEATNYVHNIKNIDNIWVCEKSFFIQPAVPNQNFPANFVNASGSELQYAKTMATRDKISYRIGGYMVTTNPTTLTVVLEYTKTTE